VPRVAVGCAWQVVAGEAVLLDLHRRRLMGLNPVGSFVFGLLDGTRPVRALADAVSERFGVSPERALGDVGTFLGLLAACGLVEDGRS
jgi:hypothetical protein